MAVVSCSWGEIKSIGDVPCARFGHSIELISESAYVFGGSRTVESEANFEYFNDFYKVSVNNDRILWERIQPTTADPSSRDNHSTCFADGYLYLFGGKNLISKNRCLSEVYRFKIDNEVWEIVEAIGPSPSAIGFTTSLVKSRVFVFGGIFEGSATNDVFTFSINSKEWTPIKCSGKIPNPRCDHGCEVVDDTIYVFGGAGTSDECYNDIHCLNTTTLQWSFINVSGVPPSPRAGHLFVAHRDKDIYVFGGYNASHEKECSNVVHKLSLTSKKWKRPVTAGNQPLSEELHGHAGFILHSTLYVLGGIRPSEEVGMNSVHTLRFINPSLRKPIVEYMLNSMCQESDSLSCWLPTEKPKVSYSTKSTSELKSRIADFIDSGLTTELPLNNRLSDLEFQETGTNEIQKSLFRAAQAELAFARQAFENDRKDLIKLLECERTEVDKMIQNHSKQNDSWWKARLLENNAEREKIRNAWKQVEEERNQLGLEREALECKGRQVCQLIQQITET